MTFIEQRNGVHEMSDKMESIIDGVVFAVVAFIIIGALFLAGK